MPEICTTFEPMTAPQRRHLFALLKQRGLDGDQDRHAVCGVESFRELSKQGAHDLIERLKTDKAERRHRWRRGRASLEAGEIRVDTDATNRQRRTIIFLFDRLGWPLDRRERWLWERHLIRYADVISPVNCVHIDRVEASKAITELDQALRKKQRALKEDIPF